MQIDLRQSDKVLNRQFSGWIKELRKNTGIKAYERRGARSVSEFLRALGAYRLMTQMNWTEAAKLVAETRDDDSYQDQATWQNAHKRVREAISAFSSDGGFFADLWPVLNPKKPKLSR